MYKQNNLVKNRVALLLLGGVMLSAAVLALTVGGAQGRAFAAAAETGYWQEASGGSYWESTMTAPLLARYGSAVDTDDIFFYDNLPYGYNIHTPNSEGDPHGKNAEMHGVSVRTKIGDSWYVQDYYNVDNKISGIGYRINSFLMSRYFSFVVGQVHEAYVFAVCSNKNCKEYEVGQLFRSRVLSFTPQTLIDGQNTLAPSANITYHNVDNVPAAWIKTYTRLDSVTLPLAPNKDSYEFAGWYDNAEFTGEAVTAIPANSGGNKHFYAKYEFMEEAVPLPPEPVKTGYTFGGWYFDSSLTAPYDFTPIYADTELYARFDPITYHIGYTLNGGKMTGQITGFTIESGDIALVTPTRTGYAFRGWYATPNCTGAAVTAVPTGSTEDREYYAKWEALRYTVTFRVDGEVYRTMEVDHGTTLGSLAAHPALAPYRILSVEYTDGRAPMYSENGFIVEGAAVMHLEEKTGVDSAVGRVRANWKWILFGVFGGIGFIMLASVMAFLIRRRNRRYGW